MITPGFLPKNRIQEKPIKKKMVINAINQFNFKNISIGRKRVRRSKITSVMKVFSLALILIPLSNFGQKQIYGEYSTSGLFYEMSTERLFLYDDQYFIYFKNFDSIGFISSFGKFICSKNKKIIELTYSKIFIDTAHCSTIYTDSMILKLPSRVSIQKNRMWRMENPGSKLIKMPNTNQPRGESWIGRTYYKIKPENKEYKFFLKRRIQLIKEGLVNFNFSDCQVSNKKFFFLGRESLIE